MLSGTAINFTGPLVPVLSTPFLNILDSHQCDDSCLERKYFQDFSRTNQIQYDSIQLLENSSSLEFITEWIKLDERPGAQHGSTAAKLLDPQALWRFRHQSRFITGHPRYRVPLLVAIIDLWLGATRDLTNNANWCGYNWPITVTNWFFVSGYTLEMFGGPGSYIIAIMKKCC